jgi:hypothetical protein
MVIARAFFSYPGARILRKRLDSDLSADKADAVAIDLNSCHRMLRNAAWQTFE